MSLDLVPYGDSHGDDFCVASTSGTSKIDANRQHDLISAQSSWCHPAEHPWRA